MQPVTTLEPMAEAHLEFVFQCLGELRGAARYSLSDWTDYVRRHSLIGHPQTTIWIGMASGRPVGMLLCNRFAIPYYLGFGYSLDGVVVHPDFQRRGYGEQMLRTFLAWAKQDKQIRKVIVKTDDLLRAGKLYEKLFAVTPMTVFSAVNHHLSAPE